MKLYSTPFIFGFLGGCFLSNLGSVTFLITLLAMAPKLGVPMSVLGLIIGSHRIAGFLVNSIWGHLSDHKSPRTVLLFTEFGGAAGSACLALSLPSLQTGTYWPFLAASTIRAGFIALQASASGKMTKLLDDEAGTKGQFAILVNKATFGTIFFGMFASFYFVSQGSLLFAIMFDFASFLVNGVIVWILLRTSKAALPAPTVSPSLTSNLVHFPKSYPQLYLSDLFLALVMFGANTLNARLYFAHPEWIPLASGAFGLAVWFAGPFDRFTKLNRWILWARLAGALTAQGFLSDVPSWLLLSSFLRNLPYWILYNRITAELTRNAQAEEFGKLTASRQASTILVGSAGEWWVGVTSGIAVKFEMLWRSAIACLLALKSFANRKTLATAAMLFFFSSMGSRFSMSDTMTMPLLASGKIELDPQKMENVSSVFIDLQVHRGLMRFSPELQVETALAERYEVLDSGKRFRFHLRKSGFSDGSSVSAQDVVDTFRRMFETKAGMAADLDYIEGAKQLMTESTTSAIGFGVMATSREIVEFKLALANPLFLNHLAAVDAAIYKKSGESIIGAGPYRVTSPTDQRTELTWNEHYFLPRGRAPAKILLVKVHNEEDAIRLAKEEKIDSLDNFAVPAAEKAALKLAGWHSEVTHLARSIFLSLGANLPLGVRRAIQARLLKEYEPPIGFAYRKAYGVIPDVLPGSLTHQHLLSAGLLIATKATKFTKAFKLLYLQGSNELHDTSLAIQRILERAGVQLHLQAISGDQYFKILKKGDYDLVLRSKYLDYPDALSILTYFDSRLTANTYSVRSSQIDAWLVEAKTLPHGTNKAELYRKIQIAAMKLGTLVPIAFGTNASGLWSKRVTRVPAHPMGIHSLPIDLVELK